MPTRAPAEADTEEDGFTLSPSGPYRALKEFGLVVLCAAWVLLGTFAHAPWKTEDATAFGITYEMLERGDVLTPHLAGEPYLDSPPLVYAIATATARALSPPLSMPDAARVAAALILAVTIVLIAATAVELSGREFRWMAVLIFIGSVGLWDRAHQLSPELGVLVGTAAALYGFALGARRPVAGGVILGLGVGVAFLSREFLGPLWCLVTAVLLPTAYTEWRTRRYAVSMAVALAVAIPLMAAWPLALAARAPDHLAAWWALQSPGDYFAPLAERRPDDPLFLLKNLPWFAWPALPLVLWTLWTRGRGFNGGLADRAIRLVGTMALVMAVSMTLMTEQRTIALMPLLVPLAILGALEIDTLRRGFSGALDWFGILTFGLVSALVWWLWFDTYAHGMSAAVAKLFRDTEPGYQPNFRWAPLIISVLLTLLWLLLVRPARRSNRRAVLNWAAGMTLLWALFTTIWLPYLDSRRSYRNVAESLRPNLPREGCVASRNLGEAQRALFHYYGGLVTVREERGSVDACKALLVQYGRRDGRSITLLGWDTVWEGHRRGDDTERYVLYLRRAS